MMRLKLKKTALRPKSAVLTPQTDQNGATALLERASLPIIVEADGDHRFCIPAFDEEDFVQACQYIYYCHGNALISDKLYDQFEAVLKKLRPDCAVFDNPGSDNPETYPPHVRALGLYLSFKFSKRERKPKKIRLIDF